MVSEAIASYLPDSQLIKIGVNMPAYCDPKNPRGFQGIHELAYVLHEWIHYLHNVSTIHGLSSFANMIHLWAAFRMTIGSDGFSAGSERLAPDIKLHFPQKATFSASARQPRPDGLQREERIGLVAVMSVAERRVPLPGLDITTCILDCTSRHYNVRGEYNETTVEIGSHEIIESVAYLLERHFTLRAGGTPVNVRVTPYRLLEALAKCVAPSLREQELILCGIAALQSSNPPSSLLAELRFAEEASGAGGNVFVLMEERQRGELTSAHAWIEDQLLSIEKVFPLDDAMARAVKKTVETIRSNFKVRLAMPFVELAIVEEAIRSGGNLDPILKAFGACSLLQECPGMEDDFQRDHIYEFVLDDTPDPLLHEGRRLLHAAFEFIRHHPVGEKVIPTTAIQVSRKNICPFYTSCGYQQRHDNPEVCAEQPWLTAHQPTSDLCWYGHAVRLIPPEEIAAQLAKKYPPDESKGDGSAPLLHSLGS